MHEFLTGHEIANMVIMTRTSFSSAILITEGANDCRLMDKFIDGAQCSTLPAHGKENALGAIQILSKKGLKGIAVLVDADHWHIEGKTSESEHVIVTEYHDLEMIMLKSRSLDSIIFQFASKEKYKKFMDSCSSNSLLEILLDKTSPIGALRYISKRDGVNLYFKDLNYKKIVNEKDLALDLVKFVQMIIDRSKSSINKESLIEAIKDVLMENYDLLQLCCGHDVTALLAIALKNRIGSNKESTVNSDSIEIYFRVSFEESEFKKTKVYQQMKEWEKVNSPFRLFAV